MTCEVVEAPEQWNPADFGLVPADPAAARAAWGANIGRTIGAIMGQAAGLLRLVVVDAGMLAWLNENRGGDPVGTMTLALVEAAFQARTENRPDALTCCAKCARLLRPCAFQLVAVLPDHSTPEAGLVVAIGAECATDWPEARAACLAAIGPLFGGIRVGTAAIGHA